MVVPEYVTFENDGHKKEPSSYRETALTVAKAIPAKIKNVFKPSEQNEIKISYSYSFVKILVALFQTLFAVTTLYKSKGDQIDRFGYAAFGLTVTPYALMSVINLLGSLFCPEFPAMYVVETRTLRNLRHLHGSRVLNYQRTPSIRKNELRGEQDEPPPEHREPSVRTEVPPSREEEAPTTSEKPPIEQAKPPTEQEGQLTEQEGSAIKEKDPSTNHEETAAGSSEPSAEREPPPVQTEQPCVSQESLEFQVDGTVGVLTTDAEQAVEKVFKTRFQDFESDSISTRLVVGNSTQRLFFALSVLTTAGITVGIIGGLSHFRRGSSSHAERVWTMTWLAFGIAMGLLMEASVEGLESRLILNFRRKVLMRGTLGYLVLLSAPAIGGLIVVGQMINAYGVCVVV